MSENHSFGKREAYDKICLLPRSFKIGFYITLSALGLVLISLSGALVLRFYFRRL